MTTLSRLVWVQAFFQPAQAYVCQDRQSGRRNRAGQDDLIVNHGEPAKNVFAETAGADRGSDGGRPDADHRGDADARDNRRQRQRQLDLTQQLAPRERPAKAASGNISRTTAAAAMAALLDAVRRLADSCRSTHSRPASTTSASTAAGTAPARITVESTIDRPR